MELMLADAGFSKILAADYDTNGKIGLEIATDLAYDSLWHFEERSSIINKRQTACQSRKAEWR